MTIALLTTRKAKIIVRQFKSLRRARDYAQTQGHQDVRGFVIVTSFNHGIGRTVEMWQGDVRVFHQGRGNIRWPASRAESLTAIYRRW